jgi:hypothetical protein
VYVLSPIVRRIRKIVKSDYRVFMCLSVRPSARKEQLGSHWTHFPEIWVFFRKSFQKIQVSLKSDMNTGYFTWRPVDIFYRISLSSSWMRNVRTNVVEKTKTHFLFITFIRKSCRLWDNVEKYCGAGQACAFHAGYLRLQTHNQNM